MNLFVQTEIQCFYCYWLTTNIKRMHKCYRKSITVFSICIKETCDVYRLIEHKSFIDVWLHDWARFVVNDPFRQALLPQNCGT